MNIYVFLSFERWYRYEEKHNLEMGLLVHGICYREFLRG